MHVCAPVILNISICPLSATVMGIYGGAEQKISLYADDLLVYISYPAELIAYVLDTLSHKW